MCSRIHMLLDLGLLSSWPSDFPGNETILNFQEGKKYLVIFWNMLGELLDLLWKENITKQKNQNKYEQITHICVPSSYGIQSPKRNTGEVKKTNWQRKIVKESGWNSQNKLNEEKKDAIYNSPKGVNQDYINAHNNTKRKRSYERLFFSIIIHRWKRLSKECT